MKTFKQFISEESPQELEAYLYKHCRQLVAELDGSVDEAAEQALYRGMSLGTGEKIVLLVNGKPTNCLIKTIRQNRHSVDTPDQISKILDRAFQDYFGWKARSQGMFCTGSLQQASEYGQLYQVFPIGEFKYVWSPDVKDLFKSTLNILGLLDVPYFSPEKMSEKHLADVYDSLYELVSENYMEQDLGLAVRNKKEIMIGGKTYLAVPR